MKNILYIGIFVFLVACNEIFEKDISNLSVSLIAPSDNIETEISSQTFWWTYHEDIKYYNLQVVSTSFDNIESIILDSVIEGNKFSLDLSPGDYQWSVFGVNGSSNTAGEIFTLKVLQEIDITTLSINIQSPASGLISATNALLVKWDVNSRFDKYIIELYKMVDGNESSVGNYESTTDSYQLSSLEDGTYKVIVKGFKNEITSLESSRDFIIDATAPVKPTLLLPHSDSISVSSPVSLTWEEVVDNGTAVSDSIFIARDDLFQDIIKEDVTTNFSFDFNSDTSGIFYWRVRSADEAGNLSSFSDVFTIRLELP